MIVAIIKKNSCQFDQIRTFLEPLLYREDSKENRKILKDKLNDYLWSVIEPYVTFMEVNQDDFLEKVCMTLTSEFPERKPDNDFYYHVNGSYSFPKKYIEFAHCQPLWKEYQKSQKENMNCLGCLFSLDHKIVENTCVVFANKYDKNADKNVRLDSITKEDILRVIRRRFYFSAILIKENSLVKYYYQHPKYLISHIYQLTDNDTIENLPVTFLKYNLVFYFKYQKDKYPNQIATRINGLYRLYGDVLMFHELEENIPANLSIHEAKRLNVLAYGRLYDRQLRNNEIHQETKYEVSEKGESEKQVTPYWSKYLVVENRMANLTKNKCINCSEEMKNPIVCDRCYRVKYCSLQCKKEFNHYHNDECINPKSY